MLMGKDNKVKYILGSKSRQTNAINKAHKISLDRLLLSNGCA